jgi:CRISPR-associated protein Cas1
MSILYVVTDGASIRKRGESFIVTSPEDEVLTEVEARRLEHVCILSSVQVTTQALAEMLEHGVELAILSSNGKLLGQLTPPLAKNIELRRAQFEKERDPAFALAQAKEIVVVKISNQREVLVRYALDEPGEQPETSRAAVEMERMLQDVPQACNMDVLRGIEGACARAYWGVFGEMLKAEGVSFPGRQQHPSPDPVNAALSFGYVLLGNMLHSLLDGLGFDPFLGFFHEESYGRASLALDLLEPFRAPVVDRFVLRAFNLGVLKPDQFQPDGEGGLRLTPDALKSFFREWERALHKIELRLRIREQAEDLRNVFLGKKPLVTPWRWSAR